MFPIKMYHDSANAEELWCCRVVEIYLYWSYAPTVGLFIAGAVASIGSSISEAEGRCVIAFVTVCLAF